METSRSELDVVKARLAQSLAKRDANGVAQAVGEMACRVGASAFARGSGLSRESLHRLSKNGGNLRMDTLFRALKELDISLQPVDS